MSLEILDYQPDHERGWLHCRVLSFLYTQYYNDVYQKKERYDNNAIELVAVENKEIVGILDIEIEKIPQDFCSSKEQRSGMLWHIATHPDHQRKGIGNKLLNEAEQRLKCISIDRIEAWTKEDLFTRNWYKKNGFQKFSSYFHTTLNSDSVQLKEPDKNLLPVSTFAHYMGQNPEALKNKAVKIEECIGLEKKI